MNTRRSFLSRSGLVLAASSGAAGFGCQPRKTGGGSTGSDGALPEKIIHLVSDGMSMGTFTCADYLSQQVRERGLVWTQLLNQPGAFPILSSITEKEAFASFKCENNIGLSL